MQSLVIRKTLESISLDHRRGEEIIQEQPSEIKENAEVIPSNKEEVNQIKPGEQENKE